VSSRIAASILAADFGRLTEDVRAATEAGADWIHVDVMDGHFVPNITLGPAVVSTVRQATDLPLDVHLMIEDPDRYLEVFVDSGADVLTVHQEACPHLHRTVQRIREIGARPGVSINPATPVETLTDVIPEVDLVLVMSVNPGFGGQHFIPGSLAKIERARRLLRAAGRNDVELEVDGGVGADNAAALARAGVTMLVAGSAVFRHPGGVQAGVGALKDALATGS
jgi:ribulose-phosphate 3-epimerase